MQFIYRFIRKINLLLICITLSQYLKIRNSELKSTNKTFRVRILIFFYEYKIDIQIDFRKSL